MRNTEPVEILAQIKETRLLPLFYHSYADSAVKVMQAVSVGGINILEFTNRGPGAFGVFEKSLEYRSINHSEMLLGIGSIVDASTAEKLILLIHFIVIE